MFITDIVPDAESVIVVLGVGAFEGEVEEAFEVVPGEEPVALKTVALFHPFTRGEDPPQ